MKFWMIAMIEKIIKITQIRSTIGCLPKHKATIRGLGLRGIGTTVYKIDTSSIRGMVTAVFYLIKVE